ncbi:Protein of unknown function [Cotesia congregata]|uniref:Uncharacterized protein n=1 Tax=Cotesia congregata TaxID=51543 RepID=A0A8J2H927_COTCN|nr:Protein of unknown function [Cotesia congregata]
MLGISPSTKKNPNVNSKQRMGEAPKYYGKRRSLVRRIGSFLPLKPPPKIYVRQQTIWKQTRLTRTNKFRLRSKTPSIGAGTPGIEVTSIENS